MHVQDTYKRRMPRKTPVPPSREALVEFLRNQHDRPIAEVAALLGTSIAATRQRARDEDAILRGQMVSWDNAAHWLVDVWPHATLVQILGPDAHLFPDGFQPVALALAVPAFIFEALRVQWQMKGQPGWSFEDYLSDVLFDAIEMNTVAALRPLDREFRRAYFYPLCEHDDGQEP